MVKNVRQENVNPFYKDRLNTSLSLFNNIEYSNTELKPVLSFYSLTFVFWCPLFPAKETHRLDLGGVWDYF